MKDLMLIAVWAFLICGIAAQSAHYDRVLVDDPSALCLDGSPGAYYYSIGSEPDKVILYFEGGGWCGAPTLSSTIQSCYTRSKTTLGSSKTYPQKLDIGGGILSNSQSNSFKNWTKVFLKYCSGAGHQGSRAAPLPYKGVNLFFRGNNITYAQLNSVNQKIGLFKNASEVMVAGGSAGGLATFLWADEIKSMVSAKKVWAVPDSGIFLDELNVKTQTMNYKIQFQNLFSISNTQSGPPTPDCLKNFPGQPYRCMFAENLYKFIKTPIFAIQSLYDTWSIPNVIGVNCVSGNSLSKCNDEQISYIENYHQNTEKVLRQLSIDPKNGVWAPVCADHVYNFGPADYSPNFRIPEGSQNSIDLSVFNWIKNQGSHVHIDTGKWPQNKPCSGLSQNLAIQIQ